MAAKVKRQYVAARGAIIGGVYRQKGAKISERVRGFEKALKDGFVEELSPAKKPGAGNTSKDKSE